MKPQVSHGSRFNWASLKCGASKGFLVELGREIDRKLLTFQPLASAESYSQQCCPCTVQQGSTVALVFVEELFPPILFTGGRNGLVYDVPDEKMNICIKKESEQHMRTPTARSRIATTPPCMWRFTRLALADFCNAAIPN